MQNARVSRLRERPPSLRFGAQVADPRKWAKQVRAAVQRLALPAADGAEPTAALVRPAGVEEFPAVLLCLPAGSSTDLATDLAAAGIGSLTIEFADDPAA